MPKNATYAELINSPKSWKIDYSHENGKCMCLCLACDESFLAHKRRKLCYECAEPSDEDLKLNGDKTA